MTESLYDHSSVTIALYLLLLLALSIEVGYRLGRRVEAQTKYQGKSQITAIQASTLGILALLLGFTFSQSLSRYDARSASVVEEANAIGTAYLRADLVPSVRQTAKTRLREYVDLRVRAAGMTLANLEEKQFLEDAEQKQSELWQLAEQAVAADRDEITALFVASLNGLTDAYGQRRATVARHVPQTVWFILMITLVLAAGIVGIASGVEGQRPPVIVYALSLLIVLLTLVVIDLDRPRRGFIEVSQESLIELQSSIQAEDQKAN